MCCTTCWTPTGTICDGPGPQPAWPQEANKRGWHRLSAFFRPDGGLDAVKDFFDTWKFRILIAVAVFLAGLMLYAAANGRLTAAPQELLSVAVAPFQKVAAVISGGVASVWDKYTSIDETMAENEALREENAQLRRQLADYDQLKAENEAYKNLAGIQEDNPEMSFVSAFVIGRDALDAFGGFTLDKGTVNGVERGDTVIDDQGRLLGTVIEADLTSCRVLTILHPSFNAAGVVSRTRDNGILTGDAAYAAEGQCVFTDLSRESMASVGDEVITTGLGGVYPPDILVGRTVSIEPEASGTSVVAVIQPDADVLGAKQAFIITDY